ncbi:MAG: helix-turn-helix transcriptional regulator [Chloroflexi bacterium]|nr:helix-turn-helix transcriptional regulator [Chloroflexota bacterium]
METIVLPPNIYAENCPTRRALDMIADRWTVLVIGMLADGPQRFSAIQRRIGGISQKMLTQTLRELERSGIVSRTVYAEVPPRVEYELTSLGETLCAPIKAIREWAESNIAAVNRAQSMYDERVG